MNICIIPARGGSKRIPRKNIRLFLGKPIIHYTIEAAIESKLFDEVMVSTNDNEIADISKLAGAKVPFLRSERNSNDVATISDVMLEVLEKYSKSGRHYDYACCCFPTAPFITVKRLKEGIKMLTDTDAEMVYPVTEFEVPIYHALRIDKNGYLKYVFEENKLLRSQDFEKYYYDAAQWYWFNVSSFLKIKTLEDLKTRAMIIDRREVQDINYPVDWEIAELKYRKIHEIFQ